MSQFNKSFILYGPPDSGKMTTLKKLPLYEEATLLDLSETELIKEVQKDNSFLQSLIDSLNPGEWLIINHYDRIHKHGSTFIEDCLNKGLLLALTAVRYIPDLHQSDVFNIHYQNLHYNEPIDLALKYGVLPKVQNILKPEDKVHYLKNYIQNYINEHVLAYSSVRQLVPFHLFMENIKNYNAQKINFTKIADELNVEYKTVQHYFQILIQTHMGFYLPASPLKLRSVQNQTPQFYMCDPGLAFGQLDAVALLKTLCINQLRAQKHLHLSHLETKDGVGIDLIIHNKLTNKIAFVIFCNQTTITKRDFKNLVLLGKNQNVDLICVNLQTKYKIKPADAGLIQIQTVTEFLKTVF